MPIGIEKMYADAEPLFLEGTEESAKALGQMLHEWAESEFPEERQFVITRDVLQYVDHLAAIIRCVQLVDRCTI